MSSIFKGEIVLATVADYGRGVRSDERGRHTNEWVREGQELEVTSVRNDVYLNVRLPGSTSGVFRWRREHVRRVRQVGVAPEGAILPDDPRLAWLWEDASRLAERFGFCSEFDRLAENLGVPGREREFRIPMVNEGGLRVVATVTARSRALAERRIRERIASAAPLELTGGES